MGDNKGISPVVAGVVGAAVGAAATVAAVELSDEKNRKAVAEKLGELKEQGQKVVASLEDTAMKARDGVLDLSGIGKDKPDDDSGSKAKSD